jgi:hypothetical protein
MPLDHTWVPRLKWAWRYILENDGAFFVDGTEAMSPETVINAINGIEDEHDAQRALGIATAIEKWGQVANNGRKIVIYIDVPAGSILVDKAQGEE